MVKRREWILMLASGASALSLVAATASLVIALIAAASPPVWKYFDAQQTAAEVVRLKSAWMLPAFMIGFTLLSASQIVLRRPFLSSPRWRTESSGSGLTTVCVFVVLAVVSCFMTWEGTSFRVSVLRAATGPITDCPEFSALGSSLFLPALLGGMLSTALFEYWRKAAPQSQPAGGASDRAASVGGV